MRAVWLERRPPGRAPTIGWALGAPSVCNLAATGARTRAARKPSGPRHIWPRPGLEPAPHVAGECAAAGALSLGESPFGSTIAASLVVLVGRAGDGGLPPKRNRGCTGSWAGAHNTPPSRTWPRPGLVPAPHADGGPALAIGRGWDLRPRRTQGGCLGEPILGAVRGLGDGSMRPLGLRTARVEVLLMQVAHVRVALAGIVGQLLTKPDIGMGRWMW